MMNNDTLPGKKRGSLAGRIATGLGSGIEFFYLFLSYLLANHFLAISPRIGEKMVGKKMKKYGFVNFPDYFTFLIVLR
jgi:hypothetical protein